MSFVRSRSVWALPFVIVAGSLLVMCGGSTNVGPEPTPAGAATPTPTAKPTSAPSPLPGMSCGLPAIDKWNGKCDRQDHGDFQKQVELAANTVLNEHPEYFGNNFLIRDIGGFRVGVIKHLEEQGLCAMVDGDEIAVKNTND